MGAAFSAWAAEDSGGHGFSMSGPDEWRHWRGSRPGLPRPAPSPAPTTWAGGSVVTSAPERGDGLRLQRLRCPQYRRASLARLRSVHAQRRDRRHVS